MKDFFSPGPLLQITQWTHTVGKDCFLSACIKKKEIVEVIPIELQLEQLLVFRRAEDNGPVAFYLTTKELTIGAIIPRYYTLRNDPDNKEQREEEELQIAPQMTRHTIPPDTELSK